MSRDPYQILGVSSNATDDEIKASYRKLAKKYHPDLNGGSAAAEAKMKEVNEAYTYLIKNKGKAQQPFGGGQPSGNPYGGGQAYGNPFGGYYQGNQSSSSGQGYNPFADFEQFFRQSQQRQASSNAKYTEYDQRFKFVEDAVLDQDYARASQLLGRMNDRPAQWYYWSAKVSIGLGNRMSALQNARTAVEMAPDEEAFRDLLNQLQGSGSSYQRQGSQYGFSGALCGNPCLTCIAANVFCNCCCNGSRYGFCC